MQKHEHRWRVPDGLAYERAVTTLVGKGKLKGPHLAMLRHIYEAHNRTATYTELANAAARAGAKVPAGRPHVYAYLESTRRYQPRPNGSSLKERLCIFPCAGLNYERASAHSLKLAAAGHELGGHGLTNGAQNRRRQECWEMGMQCSLIDWVPAKFDARPPIQAKRAALLALAGITLLASCTHTPPTIPYTDGLSGVWMEMLAPYGIYPLFPVRTHVQPGDVYILCKRQVAPSQAAVEGSGEPSTGAAAVTRGEWVHLFSLNDVNRSMEDYAKSRMAYQAYVVGTAASAAQPMLPASAAGNPYTIGSSGQSVGFASFPSILSYTQKRTDFGVGTVAGVVAIGAGANADSQGFYTLEIPSVEYAYLPHEALQDSLTSTANNIKPGTKEILRSAKSAIDRRECVNGSLSVVGAVYYTRHITVSLGDSYASALAARAAYQLPTGSTREAVYEAIGSYASGASAPSSAASSPFSGESGRLAKLMLDIDKVYKAADENSKPGYNGVKVAMARSEGKGVSMDYSYGMPVAFGVKLFAVGIAIKDNEVVGLDPVLSIEASRLTSATRYEEAPMKGQGLKPRAEAAPPASSPASSSSN